MMPTRDIWLVLALLMVRWVWPGWAWQCQDGELRSVWGDGTKCCPKCSWKGSRITPCKAAQDPDCKCPQEYSCADEPCQYCLKLPQCELGWEPHRIGKVNFQFECKPCDNGTYSNGKSIWCRNWTDCESSGFITIQKGNSTHNSVCGFYIPTLGPAWIPLELRSSTILAILTAVAVAVLVLLTFLLPFCLWSLRKDKKFPLADLGPNFPRLPLQGEESHSIQFPEEEHGDKSDEKLSILSLKIYSELR